MAHGVDERAWRQKINHGQGGSCRCGHNSRQHTRGEKFSEDNIVEVARLGSCDRCRCEQWCPAWHDELPNFCHRGTDPYGLYSDAKVGSTP